MTRNFFKPQHLLLVTAMSLLVVMTVEPSYATKPNCNVDPSHPSCGDDGGGGDPGGGDACLDSTTFPSFAYWGSNPDGLYLSDATGVCTQQISSNGGACLLGEMKMQYTAPASEGGIGNGRVVSFCWDDTFLWEFSVAPDNSVSVSIDFSLIMSTIEGGIIGDLDIANDRDSLAFSFHWADGDGNGITDGESLYIVSIDDCLRSTWIPSDQATCNNASGSRQEILSIPNTNPNDATIRWTGLSWSHNGTKIYLNQRMHASIAGIQVAEKDSQGEWGYSGVASGDSLGGGTWFPTATSATWDNRGDREIVAFRFDNGNTQCDEIYIIDVEDCRDPVEPCGNIGPDIYGRTPSFTNDGLLVFNQLTPKGKSNCRNPGKISIVRSLHSRRSALYGCERRRS